ncbi:RNA polymerase sigma factor SigJ [Agromyces aurantiacus]|uniref:RNA polymerase sigma factor SigJ n=1 Tax=Agromyces aurantiacus TaxID=165814 RepID=A0ABV9R6L1_9MICO|nr:RNA polymerase sigma factor SigJ [Agromyces aurantiacus]MBM7503808.1 RNA polymerase sigma-70 factor (ECF subfamily) [Agromyces aurantiacus]
MTAGEGTRAGTTAEAVALEAERRTLTGLAYRMLGTIADAEDAVQETYARWYRMSPAERDAIANPGAWLVRAAGRVCLDQLGSARARREHYVGDWLPEPLPDGAGMFAVPAASDPLDRVALDESVSTALLIVLESLTPAERVAFVLHDVFAVSFAEIAEVVGRSPDACRQLATSARRKVRERRAGSATREEHDEVVRAFIDAAGAGDVNALLRVLDPEVVLVSDGGGLAWAARRPVVGAEHVGRMLLGIRDKRGPALEASLHETADGLTIAFAEAGVVDGVFVMEVRDGRITRFWIMRNPEKLRLWNA